MIKRKRTSNGVLPAQRQIFSQMANNTLDGLALLGRTVAIRHPIRPRSGERAALRRHFQAASTMDWVRMYGLQGPPFHLRQSQHAGLDSAAGRLALRRGVQPGRRRRVVPRTVTRNRDDESVPMTDRADRDSLVASQRCWRRAGLTRQNHSTDGHPIGWGDARDYLSLRPGM